jgi:hypothetical protein
MVTTATEKIYAEFAGYPTALAQLRLYDDRNSTDWLLRKLPRSAYLDIAEKVDKSHPLHKLRNLKKVDARKVVVDLCCGPQTFTSVVEAVCLELTTDQTVSLYRYIFRGWGFRYNSIATYYVKAKRKLEVTC